MASMLSRSKESLSIHPDYSVPNFGLLFNKYWVNHKLSSSMNVLEIQNVNTF